ncbi:MAG: peptidoglycan recognition protein family protein [Acidimicrobiales bacterium]
MARYTGAAWHGPVPNCYGPGTCKPKGIVLHVMESGDNGTLGPAVDGIYGCDAWFHNPQSQVSAHFGTGTKGELWQWVDTDAGAWAEVAGNSEWISVENAGNSGDKLLKSQLDSCAEILAWAHRLYGVPLQAADDPSQSGLGYHAMGGTAWGDHPQCPGQPIIDQRPEIIGAAKTLLSRGGIGKVHGLRVLSIGMRGHDVAAAQVLLNARDKAGLAIDGIFGPSTADAVASFTAGKVPGTPHYIGPEVWFELISI